ncbi:hypothetical protein BKA80DRAFT_311218 [Phyllosticta citrichinensis]
MVFIVRHEVRGEDINCLLKGHHLFGKRCREWQRKVLNFVHEVVTKKILPPVKGTDSDPMKMDDIGDRFKVWAEFYHKDEANIARKMWAPVKWVIDWDAIYDPPKGLSKQVKDILRKWRTYFLHCFLLAADYSFLFRNAAKERPELTTEMRAAGETEYKLFRSTPLDHGMNVPDITELPVPQELRMGANRQSPPREEPAEQVEAVDTGDEVLV